MTTILLCVWLYFDLILWATEKPAFTMFFWSIINMIEPMIYAGILFFMYAFIDNKDILFKQKLLVFVLLSPTVILTWTNLNLSYYDLTNCWREAIEGPLPYYSYAVEGIFAAWILGFGFRRFFQTHNKSERNKIALMTSGAVFFLFSFAMGNVVGSLLVNWEIGQYGLFGIPIFVAMLSYLVARYHLFNIKLISSQLLVVAIWLLTLAILFIQDIDTVRNVVVITLILFTALGYLLIKSVKREVEQREHIEKLALDLEKANARLRELDQMKSQFLSFASHQIRSPLTAIKGYTSMALEGDFGEMPEKIKGVIETLDKSAQSLIVIVNEFLDVSRIEQGRMKYEMSDFDVRKLVEETVAELRPNVEQKGLKFTFDADVKHDYRVYADQGKIKQVIGNIVDNAIKYTPSGSIDVKVSRTKSTVNITVSDTGVGIEPDVIPKLFSMFGRAKDASKTNVTGTGLGLYVAKQMIEAHRGQIWIESEGKGKGSTFHIELPAKN
ncbi:MAG: hypothetical protein A3E93_00130 [Candidatus Zambryskibacteria bacterium RIFCSPHIGHO2_12_FULL_43_12b]|uniref:histidine kinase n=1 Tax=Candidatus Zambryskibacteria bacterium RIFCSPLOWO2_01_FULL_43_17 TaxID=1802760 RepID=A0A1G2U4B0_9BACT|nr:MAG: hypothetical protein A3E93_00130 [Candidatus Zambryskibacteria bacterium RIFCSPHIGHO2_12_FULL_43_12b]OHB03662.1 MAG: hypothetical protein A2920_03075 [Candidatus Zambryskibacteria bacterium RIFCSPLOWO2_01_FULL_43_17]